VQNGPCYDAIRNEEEFSQFIVILVFVRRDRETERARDRERERYDEGEAEDRGPEEECGAQSEA
jgi:hypothetical protein